MILSDQSSFDFWLVDLFAKLFEDGAIEIWKSFLACRSKYQLILDFLLDDGKMYLIFEVFDIVVPANNEIFKGNTCGFGKNFGVNMFYPT